MSATENARHTVQLLRAPVTLPAPRRPAPSAAGSTIRPPQRTWPEQAHRRRRTLLSSVALLDVTLLVLASTLAWELRGLLRGVWVEEAEIDAHFWSWPAPLVVGTWVALLMVQGVWRPRHLAADLDEFRSIAAASAYALGGVVFLDFAIGLGLARAYVLLTFALGTPLLLLSHLALRKAVHLMRLRGALLHRVLVVGPPSSVTEVRAMLADRQELGYQIVGMCTPGPGSHDSEGVGVPHVGRVDDVRRACASVDADTVLVAGGGLTSADDLRRIGWQLQGSSVRLVVAPSLVDVAGPRIQMRVIAGLPLVHVEEPQVGQAGGLLKRVFDILGSGFLLLLAAPVLLVAAILVKLEDGGPVLYRQERVGRGSDPFACLKLRTMRPDADKLEAELRAACGHEGALWKMEDDPRITRVGRILRRFSIDELPQLWNVFVGQMSLVGPRPQQRWEVETYDDDVRRRLLVRPGMTGLWQVSGRSGLTWREAVRLDLYYVDNWSMVGDLAIIVKTVRVVLSAEGAS